MTYYALLYIEVERILNKISSFNTLYIIHGYYAETALVVEEKVRVSVGEWQLVFYTQLFFKKNFTEIFLLFFHLLTWYMFCFPDIYFINVLRSYKLLKENVLNWLFFVFFSKFFLFGVWGVKISIYWLTMVKILMIFFFNWTLCAIMLHFCISFSFWKI